MNIAIEVLAVLQKPRSAGSPGMRAKVSLQIISVLLKVLCQRNRVLLTFSISSSTKCCMITEA